MKGEILINAPLKGVAQCLLGVILDIVLSRDKVFNMAMFPSISIMIYCILMPVLAGGS